MLTNLKSDIEGISWPAIPSPGGTAALAILFQLEKIQYWSHETIIDYQFKQLSRVLDHAYKTIPFYRNRFDSSGIKPSGVISEEQLRKIPLLTRQELQETGTALRSSSVPKSHGKITEISTSGSTGRPVNVLMTDLASLFWRVIYLREHIWQKRDLSQKLVAIRFLQENMAMPPHGSNADIWGTPEKGVFSTGPAAVLNIKSTISQQANWLITQDPGYLASYPSNIQALAEHFIAEKKQLPGLLHVRSIGEILSPDVRKACQKAWNVPVVDMYSCNEVGGIALQCPDHEHYHIQSENLVVEILNGQDKPCAPGEIGRVVVTTLHNFAMPLIRYEIGDFAEVGEPCRCGRGLPVITKVLGRQRNMLTLPDGQKIWPVFGVKTFSEKLPIKQFQFVQKTLERLEARLVTERPLSKEEETLFKDILHNELNYPFSIKLIYLENIPRSKGGKYEDFISELT